MHSVPKYIYTKPPTYNTSPLVCNVLKALKPVDDRCNIIGCTFASFTFTSTSQGQISERHKINGKYYCTFFTDMNA